MEKEEKSVEKKDVMEDYLKLKRSNEKKKAVIVVLIFAIVLILMITILFYCTLRNDVHVEDNHQDNDISQSVSNNSYQEFSNNLKKEILGWKLRSYLARDGVGYLDNKEVSYKIILTNKMELIMVFDDDEYQKKYGEIKISENVISFAIAQSGPGAYQNVYFIKEDGTVGEAIPFNLFDEEIKKVTVNYPLQDLKKIVSIVNTSYQDLGYMQEPAFIDINGNVFSPVLSAWD